MIGILAHRRQIVDKEDLFYPIPLAAVEGAYFQGKGGEKRGLLLRETEGRREGTEKEGTVLRCYDARSYFRLCIC